MAAGGGKVPIFESAGQAVGFLREHWRFAAAVAGMGALAQAGAFLLLGPNVLWLVVLGVVGAAVTAAFLGAAIKGEAGAASRLGGDGARVFASMSIVGFFMAIAAFMILYVAMSVLIAPYAAEAQAAQEDQAALMAIMNRAIEAQPSVIMWSMIVGGVVLLALTSRLYLAAPGSVAENRIVVFDSWRWTKGNMLRIAAARIVLLGPALILVGALQSIAALALGAPGGNPAALAGLAASNPVGFALFYAVASFFQLGLFGALEAGLSAYLYRGLKPPAQ